MFKIAWNKKAKAEGAGTKGKQATKKAKAECAGTMGKQAEEAGDGVEVEVTEASHSPPAYTEEEWAAWMMRWKRGSPLWEDALEAEQQAVEVAEAGRLAAAVENAALRPRAKSTVHLNAFMRPRESAIMASPVDRNLVHLKRVASKGMGAGHPI